MAATLILGCHGRRQPVGFAGRRLIERICSALTGSCRAAVLDRCSATASCTPTSAHLLFNCLTYWFFAFPLQRVIGSRPLRRPVPACGLVASNIGTYFKHRHDPEYACLGASGAMLAVLFAAIVYFPRSSLFILPLPIPIPAPLFARAVPVFTYYSPAIRAAGSIIRPTSTAHWLGSPLSRSPTGRCGSTRCAAPP